MCVPSRRYHGQGLLLQSPARIPDVEVIVGRKKGRLSTKTTDFLGNERSHRCEHEGRIHRVFLVGCGWLGRGQRGADIGSWRDEMNFIHFFGGTFTERKYRTGLIFMHIRILVHTEMGACSSASIEGSTSDSGPGGMDPVGLHESMYALSLGRINFIKEQR